MLEAAERIGVTGVETAQRKHEMACVDLMDFRETYLMSEL
jgi:hypothetical protein